MCTLKKTIVDFFSIVVIDILLSKAGFSLKNRDDSKEARAGI